MVWELNSNEWDFWYVVKPAPALHGYAWALYCGMNLVEKGIADTKGMAHGMAKWVADLRSRDHAK